MKYLIGNWKANKTINEAQAWISQVKKASLPQFTNLTVVLCPSYIHLSVFKKKMPELILGCQNISPYSDGAYTGQITARMVTDTVKYVILGHSERVRYFNETVHKVAMKAQQAVDFKITPIIAVDSKKWRRQLNVFDEKLIKNSIIMYEPPEAISEQIGSIGRGEASPIKEVTQMISQIKKQVKAKAIIYGGSIKSDNIKLFLQEPEIDGVLPGSASLNSLEWIKMIERAHSIVDL